jgi:hypothetical protein
MSDELQTNEQNRDRIQLPQREEIRTCEDRAWLEKWSDFVHAHIAQMETDLEFRSDERADEGWEHRCRRALTAYKIVRGQLTQRIAQLGRGGVHTQRQRDDDRAEANKERSLRNREVQELASANALERKRQILDAGRLDVERRRVDLARKLAFLHVFRGVAFDLLPRETYDQLNAEAASRQSAAVLELATPDPAKEGGCQ